MIKNNFGQDKNATNFGLLELCCQKVASKFGNTTIESWKNSDYVQLSALLRRETKVLISENTLKRLFGKLKTTERYYPQKATRDALAAFIGFRDWQEFETVQQVTQSFRPPVELNVSVHPLVPPKDTDKNRLLFYGLVGVLLFIIATWLWWPTKPNLSTASLHCLNPNGHSPHSAVFKLLPKNSNSLLSDYEIDLRDWKGTRSKFKDSTLTHYYEMPGVYYPVLLYKNKVVDTSKVYLETDSWEVTAQIMKDTVRVYPITLPLKRNKKIPPTVNIQQVLAAGVDTIKTFFTNYATIQHTEISGDNMLLEAFITTSKPRPGVRCSQVDITLFGENDKHFLSLMKPECVSWCSYQFSEKSKSGKFEDLRDLGHDLSMGQRVKLTIINKVVSLYIEDKKVFETKYEKSIGKIAGINLMFAGVGKFSDFKIKSLL